MKVQPFEEAKIDYSIIHECDLLTHKGQKEIDDGLNKNIKGKYQMTHEHLNSSCTYLHELVYLTKSCL